MRVLFVFWSGYIAPYHSGTKKILFAHECTRMDIALEGWYEVQ